jgi:hypothetical protein
MAHEQRRAPDQRTGGPDSGASLPALKRICERFPALRDQAAIRFAFDETFRELCEDYDVCAISLAHIEASDRRPEGILDEYAALLLRLERELLRHLEEHWKFRES